MPTVVTIALENTLPDSPRLCVGCESIVVEDICPICHRSTRPIARSTAFNMLLVENVARLQKWTAAGRLIIDLDDAPLGPVGEED